ncbi:uncharacterized protein LOC120342737 [Styela clava]
MPSAITRTSAVSYLAFGDVDELDKRLNELTAKYVPKHRRIISEYGYHYESLSNDMEENCSKVRKMQGDACGFEMKDNQLRKDVITSDYMDTTALIRERRRKLKNGISSRQQMEEISQKISDLSNVQEKFDEISRKHKKHFFLSVTQNWRADWKNCWKETICQK